MTMNNQLRCPKCGQRKRRGNPANARLWLLYHVAADKLHPEGKTFTAEQFHVYFKSRFLGCEEMVLPNGKTLLLPNSTADLPVDKFNDYMSQVEADLAERGVYLSELPE